MLAHSRRAGHGNTGASSGEPGSEAAPAHRGVAAAAMRAAWLLLPALAALSAYYVYLPLPGTVSDPWKLMLLDATFRAVQQTVRQRSGPAPGSGKADRLPPPRPPPDAPQCRRRLEAAAAAAMCAPRRAGGGSRIALPHRSRSPRGPRGNRPIRRAAPQAALGSYSRAGGVGSITDIRGCSRSPVASRRSKWPRVRVRRSAGGGETRGQRRAGGATGSPQAAGGFVLIGKSSVHISAKLASSLPLWVPWCGFC